MLHRQIPVTYKIKWKSIHKVGPPEQMQFLDWTWHILYILYMAGITWHEAVKLKRTRTCKYITQNLLVQQEF